MLACKGPCEQGGAAPVGRAEEVGGPLHHLFLLFPLLPGPQLLPPPAPSSGCFQTQAFRQTVCGSVWGCVLCACLVWAGSFVKAISLHRQGGAPGSYACIF